MTKKDYKILADYLIHSNLSNKPEGKMLINELCKNYNNFNKEKFEDYLEHSKFAYLHRTYEKNCNRMIDENGIVIYLLK